MTDSVIAANHRLQSNESMKNESRRQSAILYDIMGNSQQRKREDEGDPSAEMAAGEAAPEDKLVEWLPYCIASMLCLALRANIHSTVSAKVQYQVIFYFSVGFVIFSSLYFIVKAFLNWKNGGSFWVD